MDLCSTCQSLGIVLNNFVVHAKTNIDERLAAPLCSLGRLSEIRDRSPECSSCKLIFESFRFGPIRQLATTTYVSNIPIYAKWMSPLGPERNKRSRTPSLYVLIWAAWPPLGPVPPKLTIRAVSSLLPAQPHFGRIVKDVFLNFDEIKSWLAHCEHSHSTCNNSAITTKPTEHFYLIDTQDLCIIQPTTLCRYFTLSYVWGAVAQFKLTGDNHESLARQFSLQPEFLSGAIRDAIALTGKLGERYLWIDTLCVVQDSATIRQQTLQDMDRIFAQSLLTIVAGSCSTADDPLLGVSKARTWKPRTGELSPIFKLSAHFDFKDVLQDTKYNQRAWTFQEYQVANRLLVFVPNGLVYFSCKEAVYAEDVVPSKDFDTDLAMLSGAESVRLRPSMSKHWQTYQRAVENYSERVLTKQEDALDAFSGILHTIDKKRSVMGLPVSVFDKALLWQPKQRLQCRQTFSSWSWVGWIGGVHWLRNGNSASQDTHPDLRTWIVWYSSSTVNCNTSAFLLHGPPHLPCPTPTNNARSSLFTANPRTCVPTPTLLPHRLRSSGAQHEGLQFLQFWTFSAQARIRLDPLAIVKNRSLLVENTGNGLRKFHVLNDQDRYCGWVLLDQTWIETIFAQRGATYEFVLLSEVDTDDLESDGNAFNAMIITWTDGIAKRAGLGQIMDRAICNIDVEWKEILLA
ncbi:hypothetical protein OPT61_g3614 [Boeremia exigua]|uniref:Uncharacterized protein n=1 Tax=Boeremia exigua TaxID=749465 RepID=A0ACC2IH92_9PLEO|nr:hypothetical protein OPT61_g3614 [Boeremia exigua]